MDDAGVSLHHKCWVLPNTIVRFTMFREVVRAWKAFITQVADERFDSAVRPLVPRQLVRTRKSPIAPFPRADERLFSGVPPDVRLEMRALCVYFCARRVAALIFTRRDPTARSSLTTPAAAARAPFARGFLSLGGGQLRPCTCGAVSSFRWIAAGVANGARVTGRVTRVG